MINIEERVAEKVPGETSLFITFPYNPDLVKIIKLFPGGNYSKKTKTWEIPLTYLSRFLDSASRYDQIKLKVLSDQVEVFEKHQLGPFKVQPFDHQLEAIEFGLNHAKWLLLDLPGLGKAFSLDTPVLTPQGFKEIGALTLDDCVYGCDGQQIKIQQIYDHQNLVMYRMAFSDGSDITCCRDHQWQVSINNAPEIMTTELLISKRDCWPNIKFPTCQPINFPEQQVDLDPYILGWILADTQSVSQSICHLKRLNSQYRQISESEISKSLEELYPNSSTERLIPDKYLYNSVSVRLRLIRGILDRCGVIVWNDQIKQCGLRFSTSTKQLFKGISDLIRGLGGLVYKKSTSAGYCGDIGFSNLGKLVTLPAKKLALAGVDSLVPRTITSITPVGNLPGRCLAVDSLDHLYIADNYLVTHNTLSTILLAQELHRRGKISHCLVICGLNTLKGNWKREIEKFSDLSATILGERLTKKGTWKVGSVAERAAHLMRPIDQFFVITNVESLRDERIIEGINQGPNKFELILLDEAHKCKGMSQQSQGLLKLASAPYKVAMTGTPIVSSPLDAYVPLSWLNIEHGTQTNYKKYYCTTDGPFGNAVTGYRNMDILQEIINKHSLRRTKDLLNLPPKMQIVEYVDMDRDQAEFYENIKQGVKEQVDKVKLNTASLLALLTRLRQATSCPSILTTQEISCAKLVRAVDLTEQIAANHEKVVIFSSFKEVAATLGKLLEQYHPLVCTGDSTESEIECAKDQFQSDDIHQVFIATWQKMGTGLTLNRSSNVIFIDTPYTASDKMQAEDRCHRIGTKQTVNVYTLITAGTVDERVQEIISKKEALSDYLVDGQLTKTGADFFRDYLEKL